MGSYAPINLPPLRWPSVDHLSSNGIFLLDSATGIWIRIGEEVSAEMVSDLFEVGRVQDMPQVNRRLKVGYGVWID